MKISDRRGGREENESEDQISLASFEKIHKQYCSKKLQLFVRGRVNAIRYDAKQYTTHGVRGALRPRRNTRPRRSTGREGAYRPRRIGDGYPEWVASTRDEPSRLRMYYHHRHLFITLHYHPLHYHPLHYHPLHYHRTIKQIIRNFRIEQIGLARIIYTLFKFSNKELPLELPNSTSFRNC